MTIVRLSEDDKRLQSEASSELREYFGSLSARLNRPVTFEVNTYGCQLNESDSEKICGMLKEAGLVEKNGTDAADVVVFNTCSVRENAEDRLFGNLGAYKSETRDNKDMIIAVCGCMMKVPENVERIRKSFPYVDLVFDPQQLFNLPVLLRDTIRQKKQLINVGSVDYIAEDDFYAIDRQRRFRALVPIMYGCNNFCTYCIVPYARGRERSRSFDSIIEELKELAASGYKEVMLLGQNVNSYGKGQPDGKTFADIFEAACSIEGFSRVRFMSSHPKDLNNRVIDIMRDYPTAEKHLHLALQSGSDRLLKRMNRPYTCQQFFDIADYFRTQVPEGSLTTDIIVGFPGETDDDFEDTLKAVEHCRFDSAFTFQYSKRPGTPAASYDDQVPKDIVTARFARLLDLQNEYAYMSNRSRIGNTYEVLIEGMSKQQPGIYTGRTMSNHLVNFTVPEDVAALDNGDGFEGRLANVRIETARPYSVDGIMECFTDV
ncbi:MAG: tRNA (N6-isopentenyl adenosine(37)-C2)-methylthiotransferase MiaB [Clostridiales bacterium]|nr:tRNA (N6-isopentenyl adenosine(37)-C2)-methylthiotransferase MiaB [Clostridiales bacterium]